MRLTDRPAKPDPEREKWIAYRDSFPTWQEVNEAAAALSSHRERAEYLLGQQANPNLHQSHNIQRALAHAVLALIDSRVT